MAIGWTMPEGYSATYRRLPSGEYFEARLKRPGNRPDWLYVADTWANAEKAALEYARSEATPPKPADPAWMVEVAREVFANEQEKEGRTDYATGIRCGDYDSEAEMQRIVFALRLALERGHVVDAGPIREMLLSGQGDDDGSQILPDLHEGMTLHAMVEACVHLLERRRDALDGYANSGGKPRPAPTEEEMLKAAREDAASLIEARVPYIGEPDVIRSGGGDLHWTVLAALQARRNMLREMDPDFREAGEPPRVDWAAEAGRMAAKLNIVRAKADRSQADLEAALKRAWEAEFN